MVDVPARQNRFETVRMEMKLVSTKSAKREAVEDARHSHRRVRVASGEKELVRGHRSHSRYGRAKSSKKVPIPLIGLSSISRAECNCGVLSPLRARLWETEGCGMGLIAQQTQRTVGAIPTHPRPPGGKTMTYSKYHIDGWLTDYECLTDIEGVRDVIALGYFLKDYDGTKFTCPDKEPEIRDHRMIRKWPNDKWTDCIRESDWATMKAYVGRQQNRPATVPGDSSEDKVIMKAMRNWTGRRRTRHDKYRGAPYLRGLRKAVGININMGRRNALYLKVKG